MGWTGWTGVGLAASRRDSRHSVAPCGAAWTTPPAPPHPLPHPRARVWEGAACREIGGVASHQLRKGRVARSWPAVVVVVGPRAPTRPPPTPPSASHALSNNVGPCDIVTHGQGCSFFIFLFCFICQYPPLALPGLLSCAPPQSLPVKVNPRRARRREGGDDAAAAAPWILSRGWCK